ncbi:prothoracicotropic hormone-like [Aricia agestis]|uniref:prothoracicotropic hormone-like n=1 Tax=Aricia agestis TaxID=91739 RepID=UPI001C20AC75|nr:prothoracicotropic hormone-like [Aricia agestis]
MIKLPVILLQICAIILINIDLLVPILATRKPSHTDRFLVENHRTRRKENYVLERALTSGVDNDSPALSYSEPLDSNGNTDELPAFIVDYANMIRNDIILLDNSVETRTRKRGNVMIQRPDKETAFEGRCTCEQEERQLKVLGDNYIPKTVEETKCNSSLCVFPYGCKERHHYITVLKARNSLNEESKEDLPKYFKNWVAIKTAVVVGCFCVREHDERDETY